MEKICIKVHFYESPGGFNLNKKGFHHAVFSMRSQKFSDSSTLEHIPNLFKKTTVNDLTFKKWH